MKANQVEIRADPVDGEIWLYKCQYGKRTKPICKITDQVMIALCVDMTAGGITERIERSVKFADGVECMIYVEMVK